jgi:hypothetical protein
MPAAGRLLVVSQQQDAAVRVEHDDPPCAPQPGPASVPQPGAGQVLGLASVHVPHCAGHSGAGTPAGTGRRASIRKEKPGAVLTIGVIA